MTLRTITGQPTLTDARLMTLLRETIAEARRRPALQPELKQYLADEVSEFVCELLAPSALSPEEIVARVEATPLRRVLEVA